MGSLILCHKKKAKHPYEISRIHTRISTLEELCYYLCNNLYLIDYTIMNEQLCRWIADCSKAGGTDPESWFRGEICGSCAT